MKEKKEREEFQYKNKILLNDRNPISVWFHTNEVSS